MTELKSKCNQPCLHHRNYVTGHHDLFHIIRTLQCIGRSEGRFQFDLLVSKDILNKTFTYNNPIIT